ncbi:MAG: YitT family protein, partial [Flavisolibacter sp.]
MNIFQSFIQSLTPDQRRTVENIQRRQSIKRLKKRVRHQVRDALIMLLGVISAGFGLKGFLIPNGLIDGGVMGISLLTNRETSFSLSILIVLFNIPFLL